MYIVILKGELLDALQDLFRIHWVALFTSRTMQEYILQGL